MEFYFEGGIGYGREGKTRFGNVYKTVTLGSTERTLPQFIDWVQEKERTTKQLPDYHPIRHNCHHFSSEAAEFLMNCENPLPAYLFNTVKEIVREDLGAAVLEVLLMTTHGIQHSVARLLKSRVMERLNSLDMLVNSTTACGVHTLPPTACVLFRQDSKTKTNETIMSIDPFVTLLINEGYLKEKAKAVLHDCAFQVSHMFDTIDPDVVTGYMDIVNLSLSYTPPTLWGTIFNSFRICVLQKQFSIVLVFHESLIAQLLSAARDFPRLLPSARLSFLRLLCNLASSTHGAALLGDVRYAPTWVSVVGLGLMDCKHTAILYTAACLAVNLANVIVINTSPSLKREMSFLGDRHSCTQLATIVLYNLKYRPADVFPNRCSTCS
ncbi:hypothetical protein AGDE_11452 [Angomonas deanei]|nr:hypothetical protein AGDE_11452 [Angomonas deanei]|eukprot:EPY26276.1 hypothetical protein AGDE_11452 [Angomonas deanei]